MSELSYDLFYGSSDFEERLSRYFYEAYPYKNGGGREPLEYMIAIAIKVSQYLVDKDFKGQECLIKTPDGVKKNLGRVVGAVLLGDRAGTEQPTEWLSERVRDLVDLGIFQKLLEPELKEIKS